MAKRSSYDTCQKCGASVKPENISKHMRNLHGTDTSNAVSHRNRNLIIGVVLIVVIVVLSYNSVFIKSTPATSEQPVSKQLAADAQESAIRIPISEVSTSAKWYTYDSDGLEVRYFLVKGTDGKIHLGTDACDVCYKNKKGYTQDGNVLTCNNCGKIFAINNLGVENLSGGCWPSYIPMKIENNNVIIQRTDLNAKQFMFK
jgi:uncharacterized membrane protein